MTQAMTPDVLSLLAGLPAKTDAMRSEINALRSELSAVLAELRARPASPPTPRDQYSVEEVAEMLGKRPYTVREWCRNGQINAAKRAERRGAAALWSISVEEVARYKNEGLLAVNPDRNNVN